MLFRSALPSRTTWTPSARSVSQPPAAPTTAGISRLRAMMVTCEVRDPPTVTMPATWPRLSWAISPGERPSAATRPPRRARGRPTPPRSPLGIYRASRGRPARSKGSGEIVPALHYRTSRLVIRRPAHLSAPLEIYESPRGPPLPSAAVFGLRTGPETVLDPIGGKPAPLAHLQRQVHPASGNSVDDNPPQDLLCELAPPTDKMYLLFCKTAPRRAFGQVPLFPREVGRAHVVTPVTGDARTPSSA